MQGKEALHERVRMITQTAESIVIANEEELQNATDFLKQVKKSQTSIKSFFEPMVKTAKESYDIIRGERDSLLNPLKEVEKDIRGLMNDYNNKCLQLKKAEEERIRKQKEEQERKLKELQKDMQEGKVEGIETKIAEVMNSTTLPERSVEIPKVRGAMTRTVYKIAITDIKKVPTTFNNVPIVELSKIGKEYLLKEYKIQKALGKEFEVPGIEIKEEITTVLR